MKKERKTHKFFLSLKDHETWYCTECQENGLIWSPSDGCEENNSQHDYINWYLEQKDKFAKRFLDKDK